MKLSATLLNCQICCFERLAEGIAEVPDNSMVRRGKLMIRRRLSPAKERSLKNYSNDWLNRLCRLSGKSTTPASAPRIPSPRLKAGDLVRVRSREEIEGTLNHWRQMRGCTFMAEMAEYCGTIQRVFKSMKRFVDERDLKIKKSAGIILLEAVMCNGTAEFGSCDRSCLHFWREEWLEKLQEGQGSVSGISSDNRAAGGFVKVRPLNEIEATLDQNRRKGGCTFLPEMAKYCGTVQRILKPVSRFVDERDLKVKKSNGIVVLEGVMCNGTPELLNCDRCCHLLWRKEWLEKVDMETP